MKSKKSNIEEGILDRITTQFNVYKQVLDNAYRSSNFYSGDSFNKSKTGEWHFISSGKSLFKDLVHTLFKLNLISVHGEPFIDIRPYKYDLLDLGCGISPIISTLTYNGLGEGEHVLVGAPIIATLTYNGLECHGIDNKEEYINLAKSLIRTSAAKFFIGDILNLDKIDYFNLSDYAFIYLYWPLKNTENYLKFLELLWDNMQSNQKFMDYYSFGFNYRYNEVTCIHSCIRESNFFKEKLAIVYDKKLNCFVKP